MNYRHHYHAGNFADVMKHALLLLLIRGMQRKEKGFLYLDTHAGRGVYDLSTAARGDTLERKPEWPEGVGRLWQRDDLSPALSEYIERVREFDRKHGNPGPELRYYPGSPMLAQAALRPQDRLALCELHEEEHKALLDEMRSMPRVSVHSLDGYKSLRAMLPPLEKRALVLIDPPFEDQDEFLNIVEGLEEGLQRVPGGTFAVWYPLTSRARIDAFFEQLEEMELPPCWTAELAVAGEDSGMKMRGCGLLVVNPPWNIDEEIGAVINELCPLLAQEAGADSHLQWLVPEL